MKPTVLFCILVFLAMLSCKNGFKGCGGGLLGESKTCSNSFPVIYTSSPEGFKAMALAEDGVIWQWSIRKPNAMKNIQKINIDNVCNIDKVASLADFLPFPFSGLALQSNGKVKAWNILNPEEMKEVKTEKPIKKISCGTAHVLLLNEDGSISGLGDEASYIGLNSLKNVVDIAAGLNYSIACTQDGKVYVTGMNIGNYIAHESTNDQIKDAYLINGLENIVKVGTTNTQNHYAIDKSGNMYIWDVHSHASNIALEKAPEKAQFVFFDAFYLNDNLQIKARPAFKNNNFVALDFETSEKFQNAVFVESFNRKYYLVVKRDGSVSVYDSESFYSGRYVKARIVSEETVPGLIVDLGYYTPSGSGHVTIPVVKTPTPSPAPQDSNPTTTPSPTPKKEEPSDKKYGSVHTLKGSDLRLRSAPSDKAAIIKLIPNGSKVTILGEDDHEVEVNGEKGIWLKVGYEEVVGWAWGKFILEN